MKKISLICCLAFLMGTCSTPQKEETEKKNLEENIADRPSPSAGYLFTDLDGNGINIEDYAGKRVFVNFWATWCKPCIAEMPDLEEASSILEKENYVFLFASDENMLKIRSFVEKRKFNLKFVHLNKELAELKIHSLPTTFIYDTNGAKRKQIVGAMQWNLPKVLDNLRAVE